MYWVERYIEQVLETIPEQDQSRVRQELERKIYDRLPAEPDEDDVKALLNNFGSPQRMAQQFQADQSYLISPSAYPDYIRLIKIIVPIFFAVGLIAGICLNLFDDGNLDLTISGITKLVIQAITGSFTAGTQAFLWTTIAFVIADKTGRYQPKRWSVMDLEKVRKEPTIKLSDTLMELIFLVLFLIAGVYILSSNVSLVWLDRASTQVFAAEFLPKLLWVFIITCLLGIISGITKLKSQYWSLPVGLFALFDRIVSSLLWIWLLLQQPIFSQKFSAYLATKPWGKQEIITKTYDTVVKYGSKILIGIFIAITLIECGTILYKIRRDRDFIKGKYQK